MQTEPLTTLVRRAGETHSDALVVLRHGEPVGEWHFGRPPGPILTMSITKLVVGVAFGILLDRGLLPALDHPVCALYPEWQQGRKRKITVRMLLNHTSGLQNDPNTGTEIEPAPDRVQLALCAELATEPGTEFRYNNKAVLLLAGIVQRLAGQRLDAWLAEALFAPLDITEYSWLSDPVGTPFVAGGLALNPRDLGTIGQLILEEGRWQGRPVVSRDWIATMTAPSQPFNPRAGLLYFRGVDPTTGEVRDYHHDGWLGQYLVVCPQTGYVIVRLVRRREHDDPQTDGFRDFFACVRPLTRPDGSTSR